MEPLPATVIVACYTEERWNLLMLTIASVMRQQPPAHEVIVSVDNNPQLHRRLIAESLGVTVVENTAAPGVSNARNAAARKATTPYLAFVDDDAAATAGWLGHLVGSFGPPDVVGTGGFVRPRWESGRPVWFPDEFAWVVGASYTGLPTTVTPVRNVWGENMAVRSDVFWNVGGFRGGFGKIGHVSRPEDTDLCIRMNASVPNGHWIYTPDAVVDHAVAAARSTFRFFLLRSYWEGQGKIEMSRHLGADRDLGTEGAWLRRTVPAGILRNLRASARGEGRAAAARAAALIGGTAAAGLGASLSIAHASVSGMGQRVRRRQ